MIYTCGCMGSKSHPTLHRQGWLLGPPIGAVPRRPLLRISPGDSRVLCAAFGKSRKPLPCLLVIWQLFSSSSRAMDLAVVLVMAFWLILFRGGKTLGASNMGGGCVGCGGVFCLFFKKGTLCSGNEIQIGVFLNRVGVELGFVAVRTCFCRIGNFGNP